MTGAGEDAVAAALAPALEVDAAGFPVSYAGVSLVRRARACPVVSFPADDLADAAEIDWGALASLLSAGASVRLRLSTRALPLALAHLEQAGTGPGTPTALVYRLKSPFFQTAYAGLHDMAALVRRLRPSSPVDVLVGRFIAPMPAVPGRELVGRTIAVACDAGAPCELADLLREAGARVFEQPVMERLAAGDAGDGGGDDAADEPACGQHLIRVQGRSSSEVERFSCDTLAAGLEDGALDAVVVPDAQLAGAFFRLLGARAEQLLSGCSIVACGPIAGSVVEQHGLVPALQTDSYVPSRVADAVRAFDFTLPAS